MVREIFGLIGAAIPKETECMTRLRQYGHRNYSELAFYRYQRVLGGSLHAKDIKRQEQEVMCHE